jgi:hypothetical protein
VGGALAILEMCFDRFERPDVAATLCGAGTNQGVGLYDVDLPAVVDHLRAALGDAAFDQCAATGATMDLVSTGQPPPLTVAGGRNQQQQVLPPPASTGPRR